MVRFLSIAMTIAAAALGLVACGDDNDSSSDTGAQTTGTTTDTTTGTTTEDRKSGSGKDRKSSGKNRSGGKDDNSSNSSGKDKSKSTSGGSGTAGIPTTGTPTKKTKSKSQPPLSPGNVKGTAKRVCSTFLPTYIQKELRRGKTTKEKVARNYSKGYAKSQQDDAYQGCLAGLKSRSG